MGSIVEVPVFVETNLGTRIAVGVSLDTTAGDFKRELKKAHSDCFPELGNVTVHALMVKHKSYFYHIPNSMLLKHACQCSTKPLFLHVNASFVNDLEKRHLQKHAARRIESFVNVSGSMKVNGRNANIKGNRKRVRKKRPGLAVPNSPLGYNPERRKQKDHGLNGQFSGVPCIEERDNQRVYNQVQDQNTNLSVDTPCGSLSGTVSVSRIIHRYFSELLDLNEVTSASSSDFSLPPSSRKPSTIKQRFIDKTPCKLTPPPLSMDQNVNTEGSKYRRSEVGNRLVVASNGLGVCQTKPKCVESQCRSYSSKSRRLWAPDAESLVRSLVFEIGDDD